MWMPEHIQLGARANEALSIYTICTHAIIPIPIPIIIILIIIVIIMIISFIDRGEGGGKERKASRLSNAPEYHHIFYEIHLNHHQIVTRNFLKRRLRSSSSWGQPVFYKCKCTFCTFPSFASFVIFVCVLL